ncbi:helix-turn-helix transcriptional regulator, partial [Streptomyces alkaliterrae]
LVVVIDEFDRVTGPEVPAQLEFVLRHAGAGLRLVLLARVEPLLPLHRYRAAGELVEIRAEDLAFDAAEAAALLGLHGLSLPADVCHDLVERTRGWAAGLRLCAVAAAGTSDPAVCLKEFEANRSPVADFLSAEVLARQPADVQDVLLRLSVLDRFCPDQANALTARRDAEALLVGLHRENAFVEYLGHAWYRFHPLFGEILRAHLRLRRPGLEPDLHRRAAHWLRRSGDLRAALAHGAAAGEWDFAAETLVGELALGQLLTGLRATDLSELFSGMEPGATSPAADLVRAALDLARCDVRHGTSRLRRAEARLTAPDRTEAARPDAVPEPVPETAARLGCALLEVLTARLTGSPDQAEEAAEAADGLLRELPRPLVEKHPEMTALLLTHLGSARLWAGRFEEAGMALGAAAKGPGGASTALPREDSVGHLALIDLLDGWPGRAERRVLAGASEAERFSLPEESRPPVGRLVLAAVAVERHELGRARELLDETARSRSSSEDPVAAAEQALVTARLLLGRGRARDAARAAGWSSSAATESPWVTSHRSLVRAAGHLSEGRPEDAVRVLAEVTQEGPMAAAEAAGVLAAAGRAAWAVELLDGLDGTRRGGPAVTVRAALARARIARDAGDVGAARRLVAHALLAARGDRLRRPFLDARPWIRPLLATPSARELAAGWLSSETAPAGGSPGGGAEPLPPVLEELSGREVEVLRRLAGLMSTEEIAADLYVSVNTVKTHLKGVYRKLAVHRRTDAVRRARDLGLL